MVYSPNQTGGRNLQPLTDEDRAHLTRMENVASPTGWQRGQLAALNLRAASGEDQRRTRALVDKWAAAAAAEKQNQQQGSGQQSNGTGVLK